MPFSRLLTTNSSKVSQEGGGVCPFQRDLYGRIAQRGAGLISGKLPAKDVALIFYMHALMLDKFCDSVIVRAL